MKKRLFAVFLAISVGLCSQMEAKTCLEAANEGLAALEAIGKIPNPELRSKARREFLGRIQPAIKAAIKANPELNKFAWSVGGGRWWVIYEHKRYALASAYLSQGEPPQDAKILQ